MYRKTIIFLLIVITVFLFRCNFTATPLDKTLQLAECLVEQNPDTVLHLLEAEVHPKDLQEDLYNKYVLLYVQAKDKANKDITNDTLILKTKQYFEKAGDKKRAALASFYSGHVFAARNDKEKAMLAYLDAQNYIKNEDDDSLKGLIEYYIGDINYDQLMKDEAILRYKIAASLFKKTNKYKNEIIAYNKIGVSFLMKKEVDSCFYYYNKSLILAKEQKDSSEIAYLLCNIGVAYSKIADLNNASACFRESLLYVPEEDDKAEMFLNMAYCFKNEQNTDSCLYYANKSLEVLEDKEDPSAKSIAYHLLSDVKEKEGNYKDALTYQNKYIEEVKKKMEDINNQAILDVQKKYDFELIRNDNNRLFIEKQSALLTVLGLVLFILIIGLVFYRKYVKHKEALVDAKSTVCHLKDIVDNYDEKEDSFKKILFQHFDIFKKIALLENHLLEEDKKNGPRLLKKVNDIVYNEKSLDWDMLYDTLNKLYKGFPNLLRAKYPELDETEVKIYCLEYAGLANGEIAVILGCSVNTVQMKKSVIRKKLGVDGYGNIIDFIKKDMN